jgi:hypothetical protein
MPTRHEINRIQEDGDREVLYPSIVGVSKKTGKPIKPRKPEKK